MIHEPSLPDEPARGRRRPAVWLLAATLVAVAPGRGGAQEPPPAALAFRERTPVAVAVEDGELPRPWEMRGWFLARGEPRRVLAVEKGPAEVIVVRDPSAQPHLDLVALAILTADHPLREPRRKGDESRSVFPQGPGGTSWDPLLLQRGEEAFLEAGRELFRGRLGRPSDRELLAIRERLRRACALGEGARLTFLSPLAAPVSRTTEPMNVFNLSVSFPAGRKGFLTLVDAVPSLRFVPRIHDAVWVVGHELARSGRRRAVVVLTQGATLDASHHRAEETRRTLRALQVPVFVWSFGPGSVADAWDWRLVGAEATKVHMGTDPPLFETACGELAAALAAQRVVWLEGRFAPADVRLGAEARGLRLAADPPPAEGERRRGRR